MADSLIPCTEAEAEPNSLEEVMALLRVYRAKLRESHLAKNPQRSYDRGFNAGERSVQESKSQISELKRRIADQDYEISFYQRQLNRPKNDPYNKQHKREMASLWKRIGGS